MKKPINYSWNKVESKTLLLEDLRIDDSSLSTRNDLQIMRRLFHMFNGVTVATLYLISFNHSQMIHFLGAIASIIYILDQIRVNYPKMATKLLPFTKFIIRAEEQLKESAMVPYAMAILLTIFVFPKHIAIIGIYALAIADPLSALVGIKFGKNKLTKTRTIEGSLAFFISIFLVSVFVLIGYNSGFEITILIVSFFLSLICTLADLIPIKIDDNLSIPLFTSLILWIICSMFSIYI